MSKEDIEFVGLLANIATLIALVPTFIALFVTARQLWLGRRASSAAALIAANESLRQAWLQFNAAATEDEIQYAFADVMNLLEIACAARRDGLFVGETGSVMSKYLEHILKAIAADTSARMRIEKMLDIPGTFEHVYQFLRSHRKEVGIAVRERAHS